MDLSTFTTRVQAVAPRLYRIAYLILHHEKDCEDATQEALLRAWRSIHLLRDEQFFETWLIRILVNECKRQIKRDMKNRALREADGLPDRLPDDPDHERLRDALGVLDIAYRVPIVMHYAEGYSLSEIASIESVPVSTIKWRMFRGRKLLKAALNDEEAGS